MLVDIDGVDGVDGVDVLCCKHGVSVDDICSTCLDICETEGHTHSSGDERCVHVKMLAEGIQDECLVF